MSDTEEAPIDLMRKQSFNETLDRLGFFCDICDKEVRNADGLMYFESKETVKCLRVCHDCLPENYE